MKTVIRRLKVILAAGVLAIPVFAPAASLPVESYDEFSALGDFNGDGEADVAVVDRELGALRIGVGGGDGRFTWNGPFATGVRGADGVAVGRFTATNRSDLMVLGREANRVVLLQAVGEVPFYPTTPLSNVGRRPTTAAALVVGGAGAKENYDDVVVLRDHNAADSVRHEVHRNAAGGFSLLSAVGETGRVARAGSVAVDRSPATSLLGFLREVNSAWQFQLHDFAGGQTSPNAPEAKLESLGHSTLYTVGFFAGNLPHLLFYEQGRSLIRSVALQGGPGNWSLGAVQFINFPESIQQLTVVPGDNGPDRLLVAFQYGPVGAGVYTYNGQDFPSLLGQIDRPSDANFTTAVGLSSGRGFLLFSGGFAAQGSTVARQFDFDGQLIDKAAMPTVSPLFDRANVLLFDSEPFVNDARLVRAYRVGDWTSGLDMDDPQRVVVQTESFDGAETGLTSATAVNLGSRPANVATGLVNQVRSWMSIFSYGEQAGPVVDQVRISPPEGAYNQAVRLSFASKGNLPVQYRFDGRGLWHTYDSANPPFLFQSANVEYFAQPPGGVGSRIQRASYTIGDGSGGLDSDGDTVPDFVELAKGMDPTSGPDFDGDGDTDLAELLAGTDAADAADFGVRPNGVRTNVVDRRDDFDLLVYVRPVDGRAQPPGETNIAAGVEISSHLIGGGLVGVAATGDDPRRARVRGLPLEPGLRLLSVSTPPVFDVEVGAAAVSRGREMLALVPIPAPHRVEVPADYFGESIPTAADADQWVAAARAAYRVHRTSRQAVFMTNRVADTVAALIVERFVGSQLRAIGEITNPLVTLFPDRPADRGRQRVSSRQLRALQRPADFLDPAYDVVDVLALVNSRLAEPSANVTALLSVANGIYRIHSRDVDATRGTNSLGSLAGNAALGGFVASNALSGAAARYHVPPVAALRQLMEERAIPEAYLNDPVLNQELIDEAVAGLTEIYQTIAPRPMTVCLLSMSYAGIGSPFVQLEGANFDSYVLVDERGGFFRFPPNVTFGEGTRFRVRGYTDVQPPEGAYGEAIEVVSIELLELPATTGGDQDGNLLADDWERLFYGGTGMDPFAVPNDGSGMTLLQRYLAGENPDAPSGPARDLSRPDVSLSLNQDSSVTLSWRWPTEFADDVVFGLDDAGDVRSFNQRFEGPTDVGNDLFEVTVPTDGAAHRFYRVNMRLNVPAYVP